LSDPYVGEIRIFAGKNPPRGWLFCNGQLLNVTEYVNLYSVIGTTYGGDGQTTFALPDARGRIPLHQGTGRRGSSYRVGQAGGEEKVVLSTYHLPVHSHEVHASSGTGTTNDPAGGVWAASTIAQYSTGNPRDALVPGAVGVAGGIKPHDNMMPYLPLSFIIAIEGDMP